VPSGREEWLCRLLGGNEQIINQSIMAMPCRPQKIAIGFYPVSITDSLCIIMPVMPIQVKAKPYQSITYIYRQKDHVGLGDRLL